MLGCRRGEAGAGPAAACTSAQRSSGCGLAWWQPGSAPAATGLTWQQRQLESPCCCCCCLPAQGLCRRRYAAGGRSSGVAIVGRVRGTAVQAPSWAASADVMLAALTRPVQPIAFLLLQSPAAGSVPLPRRSAGTSQGCAAPLRAAKRRPLPPLSNLSHFPGARQRAESGRCAAAAVARRQLHFLQCRGRRTAAATARRCESWVGGPGCMVV